jgi:hypothetical protein
MAEYIEKQAVINEVDEWYGIYLDSDTAREALSLLKKWVKKISPADVRPVVRSQWKKNDNGTYFCERCHSWIPEEQWHYANWCLYCGADMSSGDAE